MELLLRPDELSINVAEFPFPSYKTENEIVR
jgi:hypothetical protein